MDDKDLLIQQQTLVITNLMKVGVINQQLVTKLIDALRLYLLDLGALMAAIGQPAPQQPDFLKGLHLVKDDDKGVN